MQFIFLCVSIGAALLLASSYARSEPYDRSVFGLLTSIGLSAIILHAIGRYYPSFPEFTKERVGRFDVVELDDFESIDSVSRKEQAVSNASPPRARNRAYLILVGIFVLTARIELYRKISEASQCTSRSWEPLIALLLAVNEGRYQHHPHSVEGDSAKHGVAKPTTSRLWSYLSQSVWKHVPCALILNYGCYWINALWLAQNSTFICSIVSEETISTMQLQLLAMALDCLIAIVAQEIVWSSDASRHESHKIPATYAYILSGAVLGWIAYTGLRYIVNEEVMQWIYVNDNLSPLKSCWLGLGQGLIFSTLVVSVTYCIPHYGILQLSMILTASVTIFLGVRSIWSTQQPFPPNTSKTSSWAFILVYFGAWSSYRMAQSVGHIQPSRSPLWQVLLFILVLAAVLPKTQSSNGVHFHPIDLLMYEAKTHHEQYKQYSNVSTSLQTAVAVYQERYGGNPPPAFDKWYEYAQSRSVVIMDDYDQIHQDLLSFRLTSPADLRQQTWEMVSNPWNEISGISIRDGRAEVQENVLPTHRWMLEGVATLINSFAQYLPDMDLAFNLNDESRVTVPYTAITALRSTAASKSFKGVSTWSADRAAAWLPVAKEEYPKTIFENHSFQRNFRRFGSIGCPPESLSMSRPHLSSQSHLCIECLAPHSLGQFLSNWTLSADMCHQPDMSHLHGFYLSPAAFKTTYELVPVFSQSKASGYNDILYPSSWNYMDKAVYAPVNASGEFGKEDYSPGFPDPSFAEKQNIIFWRGATSEGVSASSHVWRGMTRQRLVHLANNATSTADHDYVTILLPDLTKPDKYTYHSLPGRALTSLGLQQTTDIRLADNIARCGGFDCTDQEEEFGLAKPVNFQSQWQYKFLFDMDGAGFSGRFLPFLQSRSLPFKTALFREWYDSRITAWRHFVPIDMRLHGVWSTLAYFAGVDGVWPGTGSKYKWEAHVKQGEVIAEEGRDWANKVLRKEDMEVYFFRLLLEWGRLTDDHRDELGFTPS